MMSREKKDPVLDIPANFRESRELKELEESGDVEKLRSVLKKGETVYRLVLCEYRGDPAVLAATNFRLIMSDKRFISSKVLSLTYSEVAAIIYSNQLVDMDLCFVGPDNLVNVKKVSKKHGKRFIEFAEVAIGSDYSIEGRSKRVFKFNDDLLHIS